MTWLDWIDGGTWAIYGLMCFAAFVYVLPSTIRLWVEWRRERGDGR